MQPDPSLPTLKDRETGVAWLTRVARQVRIQLTPVVTIHGGGCFGLEAGLTDTNAVGCADVEALRARARELGVVAAFDHQIRRRILEAFCDHSPRPDACLILGPRAGLSDTGPDVAAETAAVAQRLEVAPSRLVFDLAQLAPHRTGAQLAQLCQNYRQQGFKIALGDLGAGAGDLRQLHDAQPDLVLIAPYFIDNLAHTPTKKLFLGAIVNLAHVLGISVIATGVGAELDFWACREIGCDLVSGDLVAPPEAPPRRRYDAIADLARRDRRVRPSDVGLVRGQITQVPPLTVGDSMATVYEAFRKNKDFGFLPVLDGGGRPIGLLREADLKDYIYSPFGKDLISNKAYGRNLRSFISRCPVADIHLPAEKILETWSLNQNPEGIVIVDDTTYAGFLTASSLLRIINEKNVAQARNQNPLTKLPGNNTINDHVSALLEDPDSHAILVYVDFDFFKPFNDLYGFRQGDRAIQLFAELMRKDLADSRAFLGHVGGDDFFIAFAGVAYEEADRRVRALRADFANDVASFYDPAAREQGFIEAKDRDGQTRTFPLLTCSAALLEIRPRRHQLSFDQVAALFAKLKKEAKGADDGIAALCV